MQQAETRHTMTGSSMPAWLRKHLVDTGVLTSSGLGRKAQLRRHRDCGLPTLLGLDADRCALEATCDLGELTPAGEVHALLDGRRTYELNARGELLARTRYDIARRPAGDRVTVLAEHRCATPIPATWCVPAPPRPARQSDTEEIPF